MMSTYMSRQHLVCCISGVYTDTCRQRDSTCDERTNMLPFMYATSADRLLSENHTVFHKHQVLWIGPQRPTTTNLVQGLHQRPLGSIPYRRLQCLSTIHPIVIHHNSYSSHRCPLPMHSRFKHQLFQHYLHLPSHDHLQSHP